jgi:hypothetical protein
LAITGSARQIVEVLTHGADDSFLAADANASFWRWSSKRRCKTYLSVARLSAQAIKYLRDPEELIFYPVLYRPQARSARTPS